MVQKILHGLKYKGYPELGTMMGVLFGQGIKGQIRGKTLVPVPLHPARRRSRGYNQSEMIARGIHSCCEESHLVADGVERRRNTHTQTGFSKAERYRNMQGIFHVKDPMVFAGKDILLVDDVFTTGATLGSLGMVLEQSGAGAISCAVLACAE